MIVGIDEVGRGPWAGPVVVAAVGLGGKSIEGLTDSKKLSKKKRDILSLEIKQEATCIGIGWVSARDIDRIGMSAALKLAAKRAIGQIDTSDIEQIIIDGTIRLLDDPRVTTMKQADLLVPSVSAASIIAKVARDSYMASCDSVFPGYNFGKHAGYGTALHQAALQKLGPCPIHRMSFAPLAALTPNGTKALKPVSSGQKAEAVASEYLLRRGFKIIERNWKTKWCEIDIIAKSSSKIHFVEVKYRKTYDQGGGIAAITPKKLQQMEFAAKLWLTLHPDQDCTLSVIEVSGEAFEITQFLDMV